MKKNNYASFIIIYRIRLVLYENIFCIGQSDDLFHHIPCCLNLHYSLHFKCIHLENIFFIFLFFFFNFNYFYGTGRNLKKKKKKRIEKKVKNKRAIFHT